MERLFSSALQNHPPPNTLSIIYSHLQVTVRDREGGRGEGVVSGLQLALQLAVISCSGLVTDRLAVRHFRTMFTGLDSIRISATL